MWRREVDKVLPNFQWQSGGRTGLTRTTAPRTGWRTASQVNFFGPATVTKVRVRGQLAEFW